jgi:ligand-binding sensor domain-containing protein
LSRLKYDPMQNCRFLVFFILTLSASGCLKLVEKNVSKPSRESLPKIRVHEFFPDEPAKNEILSVFAKKGILWTGTKQGLFAYALPTLRPLLKQPYLSGQKIIDLAGSDSGSLYAVSSSKGLYSLAPGESKFIHTGSTLVRDAYVPKNSDTVYCATSHGIDILESGTWRNIRIVNRSEFGSQANDVQTLTQDKNGFFWLGTGFGVYRMKTESDFDFLYGNFQIIQGNTVINRPGNSPLGGNLFYHVETDPQRDLLLFATNGGLSILKKSAQPKIRKNWKLYTGNHTVSRMTPEGLQEFPLKGNSPLPTNFIKRALFVDDSLYIGTDQGLILLRDGNWTVYNLDNAMPGDQIHDLFHYETIRSDIVYVGTSGGLAEFNEEKHMPQEETAL